MKSKLRLKAKEYMDRAEKLKLQVERDKKSGEYHEQLQIKTDSIGNSYDSIMGRFLDSFVTKVEIDDPYIRAGHQVFNIT